MTRNRIVLALCACVLIVSLSGVAALVPLINAQRVDLQLVFSEQLGETMPPHIALAVVALGPFRGLLVDVLWYRANELKEAGEFYEANQLSEWITTLQPRFAQVWAFHAWNMAYNISVATHTPEERWDWVNKGIRLLRDRGIPYNPRAVRLYRELSWIYFHKVGRFSDDMHWYYKRQLALEWHELLGSAHEGATTEEVVARFRAIAESPDTMTELTADDPAMADLVAGVQRAGYQLDQHLLRTVGRVLMLNYSLDANLIGLTMRHVPADLNEQLIALMQDARFGQAWPRLLSFLRKRVLIRDYNMDPAVMLEVMEMFGPLDWRHPASHGAYWAALGTRKADELLDATQVDLLNTYRQNVHSLQNLMFYGRLSFDPVTQRLDQLPDPRFIPAYEKALEAAYESLEQQGRENVQQSYAAGHENFLLRAVMFSYLYGDVDEARGYYRRLRELYGNEPHNLRTRRYELSLADLVMREMQENFDLMESSRQFIDAMIRRALEQGLALSRVDTFNRFLSLARRAHEQYQARSTATSIAPQDRMALLPFGEVLRETFITYMRDASVDALFRARIWVATPLPLRQQVFDRIREQLYEQATAAGYDPARMFPEPSGMEAYRESADPQPEQPAPPVRLERQ